MNPIGLGIRAVSRAVAYLMNVNRPYVQKRGGNHGDDRGNVTRLRATKRLVDELESAFSEMPSFFDDPQSPWTPSCSGIISHPCCN